MENKTNKQEMRYDSPLNKKESGAGAITASIIIILIIIVGAFYFFSLVQDRTSVPQQQTEQAPEAPSPEELEQQSDSDNIADIEADLNAEGFDNLDAELGEIEAEFESN